MIDVLVAEPVDLPAGYRGVAVFPHCTSRGPLDLVVRRRFEVALGRLFDKVTGRVAEVLEAHHHVEPGALSPIVRLSTVPLAHFFVERLIRLALTLQRAGSGAAVASSSYVWGPTTVRDFAALAVQSANFNQAFLCRLASLWDLPHAFVPFAVEYPAEDYARTNFNFAADGLLRKVRRRILRVAERVSSGTVPGASMGYHAGPLLEAGFYISILARQPRPELVAPEIDAALRLGVRESLEALDVLRGPLEACGAERNIDLQRASQDLAFWVSEMCASEHLEGAATNLEAARDQLKPFRNQPLLMSGGPDESEIYLLAAARSLGMHRIGCQHGVHYGFTDDMVAIQELEYPFFDEFLTWGWTQGPEHPRRSPMRFTPLPSPWLSSRSQDEASPRDYSSFTNREFEVLLMTDKLQRFPPTSTGAGVVRNDELPAISVGLQGLVQAAAANHLRILHKPYDINARQLLGATIGALEASFTSTYTCVRHPHKGLSAELLDRAGVVVWDQPSTGFAECLGSGIPTMVWWPRLYYAEAPRAAAVFRALTRVGIVHETESSLVENVMAFRSAPDRWMQEPSRLSAIEDFCVQFARTDRHWPTRWRAFLRSSNCAAMTREESRCSR